MSADDMNKNGDENEELKPLGVAFKPWYQKKVA